MSIPTILLPPERPNQTHSLRDSVFLAAEFWEPRRLWYNGALALLVLGWIVFTWPHFEPALTFESAGKLLILSILANACYSAAYVVDIPLSRSGIKAWWIRWRILLWIAGTIVALVFACYWIADEIYPFV